MASRVADFLHPFYRLQVLKYGAHFSERHIVEHQAAQDERPLELENMTVAAYADLLMPALDMLLSHVGDPRAVPNFHQRLFIHIADGVLADHVHATGQDGPVAEDHRLAPQHDAGLGVRAADVRLINRRPDVGRVVKMLDAYA